jgi:hypothetical protein
MLLQKLEVVLCATNRYREQKEASLVEMYVTIEPKLHGTTTF